MKIGHDWNFNASFDSVIKCSCDEFHISLLTEEEIKIFNYTAWSPDKLSASTSAIHLCDMLQKVHIDCQGMVSEGLYTDGAVITNNNMNCEHL